MRRAAKVARRGSACAGLTGGSAHLFPAPTPTEKAALWRRPRPCGPSPTSSLTWTDSFWVGSFRRDLSQEGGSRGSDMAGLSVPGARGRATSGRGPSDSRALCPGPPQKAGGGQHSQSYVPLAGVRGCSVYSATAPASGGAAARGTQSSRTTRPACIYAPS